MIKNIERMKPEPQELPIESIEIESSLSSLTIMANYGNLKETKAMYKEGSDRTMFFLQLKSSGGNSISTGLSVEDAEGIIEALQSMVGYVKG